MHEREAEDAYLKPVERSRDHRSTTLWYITKNDARSSVTVDGLSPP